jgi:3-deoxy-7-phosphoheptulonate synthase
MSVEIEMPVAYTHTFTPEQILANTPNTEDYRYCQPYYPDKAAMLEAVTQLQKEEGVTTPEQITRLREELGSLALTGAGVVVIEGNCSEPVREDGSIAHLVRDTYARQRAIDGSALALKGYVSHRFQRRLQSVKPRSSPKVKEISVIDGQEVVVERVAYMGDGVNGKDQNDRTPNPWRLVTMLRQSVKFEKYLAAHATGKHSPPAHEALSLLLEQAMTVRVADDNKNALSDKNKSYVLTGGFIWVGKRAYDAAISQDDPNSIDGEFCDAAEQNAEDSSDKENNPILEFLASVENPIGVKIGDDATDETIRYLARTLNPKNIPGKLTFMLRMSPGNTNGLRTVIGGIKKYAQNSLFGYDIHGSVQTVDGRKIRALPIIKQGIDEMFMVSNDLGMHPQLISIETTGEERNGQDEMLQCVDSIDQTPNCEGSLDPGLNPRQHTEILDHFASHLIAA